MPALFSKDLMEDQPLKPDYITPDVELTGFKAIR